MSDHADVRGGMSDDIVRKVSGLTPAQHVALVREAATELAGVLRDATDAGVSHALILPQLVLVFRETFGSDVALPDLSQLGLGGGS